MDCALQNAIHVALRKQPTEILDPLNCDGNEIVSIVPLPVTLSPVSSLKKKLSKRDSLKKMLSKGSSCASSPAALPLTDELRTEGEAAVVNGTEGNTCTTIPKHIARTENMEGSMDIDDYCEAGMTQVEEDITKAPVAQPAEEVMTENIDSSFHKSLEEDEQTGIENRENGSSENNEKLAPVGENDNIGAVASKESCTGTIEPEMAAEINGTNNGRNSEPGVINSDQEMDAEDSDKEGRSTMEKQSSESSNSPVSSPAMPNNHDVDDNPGPSNSSESGVDNTHHGLIPFGPPPIEIIITFDTTGSMSYYLDEVKSQINDIINRLFMDIPNLKIGLIAHGDYCDENVYYLTQKMDLTNDINSLCEMVKNVEGTGGGDFAECYELILRQARLINWTPGSQRALIMIGDACPHTPSELNSAGLEEIDWQVEAKALKYEMGVRVYGVQCQDHSEAGTFWDDLAEVTKGQHLKLDKFSAIIDIIMAICYREGGDHYLQAYEKEVREREGRMLATEVDQAFGVLKSKNVPTPTSKKPLKITCGAKKAQKKPSSAKVIASKKVKQPACCTAKGKMLQKVNENKVVVKVKTKTQNKPENQKKHIRETVSEAHFAAKHLSWSPWIKVISSKADKSSGVSRSRHYNIGYRHFGSIATLDKYSDKPTLYEVAVQVKPRCRRHVVHFHATDGVRSGSWKKLVLTPKINKLIDNVLKQGPEVSIFVRQLRLHSNSKINGCNVRSAAACRKVMSNSYDYLWRKSSNLRDVVKNGLTISSSSWL